jgi:hypothetical protein
MILNIIPKSTIEKNIKSCAKAGHFQQVAYSVHGNCLTQICFGCKKIRSNYKG